jgi:hypothetical protein
MKEIALKLEDKLHKQFKALCVDQGVSMQQWLHELVVKATSKCEACEDPVGAAETLTPHTHGPGGWPVRGGVLH